MKATVKVEKEIDAKSVIVDIKPRYIGDSPEDDMPTTTPLLNGEIWKAEIDIDTGKIKDWPEGEEASLYIKVCDAGIYTLLDADGNELAQKSGYVPNDLIPGECGDYIDLKIAADGTITNWNPIDLSDFFPEKEK